jgi:Fe-S-cluster containining protein
VEVPAFNVVEGRSAPPYAGTNVTGQTHETVSLELDILTPQGRIKGLFPIPKRMRLSDLAWFAMGLDNRLVQMRLGSLPLKGKEVSCRKGCGACCNQLVPVSPAEAFMISELVASLPTDRRLEILARFAQARRRLHEVKFLEKPDSGPPVRVDPVRKGIEYMKMGIPCPFLEKGSCSIHANRPSACREYHVTTPAANCTDPGALPVQALPLSKGMTLALVETCALRAGTPREVIPLTMALEWARNQPVRGAHEFDGESLVTELAARLLRVDP